MASEIETEHDEAVRRPMPRLDAFVSWFVFALTFAVYAATCCRTIYTGDDGDFASAIATLGIPHPTGYPLLMLVGHFWLSFTGFLGDVPFRLNLLTALCGAGGVGMFCRFLCDLLDDYPWSRLWAAAGATLLGFAPTLWQQSISIEVYAPNLLFLATALYLIQGWIRLPPGDPADRRLCLVAIAYGFALTNHLTMALCFPGFMALAIWRKPTLFGRDWPILLPVIGCILLPLSLYIYLPLAARYSHTPALWGMPTDGPAFWAHITGVQYQGKMFASASLFFGDLRKYITLLMPEEFDGALLLLIALVGWALMAARQVTRPIALLLLYIYIADVIFTSGYHMTDVYVYYIPSYLVLASGIATAGGALTAALARRFRWSSGDEAKYARLAIPIFAAAILLHLSAHYADSDESSNFVEADYASSILHSCPPHAVLTARSNVAFTMWYRQFVLHDRPDVLVICHELFPEVYSKNAWYLKELRMCDPEIDKYLPSRTLSAGEIFGGVAVAETMRNALLAGRPVIFVPSLDMELVFDTTGSAPSKLARNQDTLTGRNIAANNLYNLVDPIPWGPCQRLYLKGHAPALKDIFPDVAPLWSGPSPAISPRWGSIYGSRDLDPQQTAIFIRWWESLVGWGKEAEAGHRPDLAAAAYDRALRLYEDPDVQQALTRCQAEIKAGAPVSSSPASE